MASEEMEIEALKFSILQELRDLTGHMVYVEAMLEELAPIFLESGGTLLAELETAVSQNHAPQIQRAAHALKGSSASMGIMRLSHLCLELETMARANNLSQVQGKFQEVQTEYGLVARLLESLNGNLTSR